MNPELPQVNPSAENMPQIPGGAEFFPDGAVYRPEVGQSHEQSPAQAVEQAPMPPTTLPTVAAPIPVALPVQQVDDKNLLGDDVPSVAADEDLIEKEWVDKLKKIITITKGNPYEQAKAVALLQADYLKKRYNREVGQNDKSF